MALNSVVEETRHWISTIVIGLNLCPFAQRVFMGEKIRYHVSDAQEETVLVQHLIAELRLITAVSREEIETTLLIHPQVFANFLNYNDFLDVAERQLTSMGLEGIIQIASFHPDYQFADTAPDAVENETNRSPYPMLHLLREESISTLTLDKEELREIPRRNIETLRRLGKTKLRQMCQSKKTPSLDPKTASF